MYAKILFFVTQGPSDISNKLTVGDMGGVKIVVEWFTNLAACRMFVQHYIHGISGTGIPNMFTLIRPKC